MGVTDQALKLSPALPSWVTAEKRATCASVSTSVKWDFVGTLCRSNEVSVKRTLDDDLWSMSNKYYFKIAAAAAAGQCHLPWVQDKAACPGKESGPGAEGRCVLEPLLSCWDLQRLHVLS